MATREHINIIVLLDCDLQCIRQTAPQETPTETGVLWNKKRSYPQLFSAAIDNDKVDDGVALTMLTK